MSAHTPGPWELIQEGWDGQFIYGFDSRVHGGSKRFIAEVSLDFDGAEDNARLIAAAPDLLAVLKKIRDYHVNHHVIFEIDSAIKKATGGQP
jgi:hypothetical protein